MSPPNLTCLADLQPITVVHFYLPHQLGQTEPLVLAVAQEAPDPGEEDGFVVVRAPQLLGDHFVEALPDE